MTGLKHLLLTGAGGFLGSIARYLVTRLGSRIDYLSLPFGTLVVNLLGSFVIGILIGISEKSDLIPIEWRLFLMVGLCGGFTTFSSFAGENLMLLRSAQIGSMLLYTGLSLILGLAAVWLGYASTRLLA
ncbi:MAG: fluoride efflux transporter CrcB [Bacteroidetes bacterium]|nr:MAG: fluoride efflux transporter CrcB [Bacteroidota bacterium]